MSADGGEQVQGSRHSTRSIKVLHIEGDTYVRRMVASGLPKMGKAFPAQGWPAVQVVEAQTGLDGVAKAREHLPDVIIMDVSLPGLNGLEAAAAIRRDARTTHIPIIILTVFEDQRVQEAATRAGVQRVIQKPFRWDELMKAIVEAVDRRA